MDKDETVLQSQNSFGITSSTILDTNYLESLFNNDPQQVTNIQDKIPGTAEEKSPVSDKDASGGKASTQKETPRQQPEKPLNLTIDDSASFIESLATDPQDDSTETAEPNTKNATVEPASDTAVKEPTTASDSHLSPSNIASFSKELFSLGILSSEDGQEDEPEIKTAEQLVERLTQEKQRGAVQLLENILSNYGPEYRQAFDAIYINGVSPRDYFVQAEQVATLQDLDLTIPDNQKQVLRRHYQTLGWDAGKIRAKIEKLENYQDLEEEARDIHASLVLKEKDALVQKENDRKQELSKKAAQEQEHQISVGRIITEKLKAKDFDGIPLDEKTARSLGAYMLQKKWQLGENQISDYEKDILDLSRPENRQAQVKIALLMQLLKVDPTLSRLGRKAETDKSNKLFSFLQREESTQKKQGKKSTNFFE
ncbi:hypothetical protein SAMN05428988_3212 [Chitinophaga sp. YR573]|uniref:hypothetical protein n=1 Tax=Chitinophaga sp. YR573 TaxID=1881040 RepID=UPI0008C05A11|nr:hypothetical protein [Chitinophaga sp. YR573]SEW21451.1 hypothetical protein SAMN05428988_3212 [Chitinophaga sp. YR573]